MRRLNQYRLQPEKQIKKRGFSAADLKKWHFRCRRLGQDGNEEMALRYPEIIIGEKREDWVSFFSNMWTFPAVVSAGHYMPNLRDFDNMPRDAAKSAEFGFEILGNLRRMGEADFLLYINDIHVPALPRGSRTRNPFRQRLYSDFAPPQAIRELMQRHGLESILYGGEKRHYNSFVTYIRRNWARLGIEKVEKEGKSQYEIPAGEKEFLLFDAPDSKCVGAVAYLFKLLTLSYRSCIFVYPNCSKRNIITALEVSSRVFGIEFSGQKADMEVYLIFLNHPCY